MVSQRELKTVTSTGYDWKNIPMPDSFQGIDELEFSLILFEKLNVPAEEQLRIFSNFEYALETDYGTSSRVCKHGKSLMASAIDKLRAHFSVAG